MRSSLAPLVRPALAFLLGAVVSGCLAGAQEAREGIAVSSDPELAELASELLPDLARRSGLELRRPVLLKKRSREELVRYLEFKLDEELSEERARVTVEAYALLGLLPDTLDLRRLLLDLYTEQVAGFYEPDSTALFVLDDQPEALLQGLLVHELVHAVQDQSADLEALTDPDVGNDRSMAAHAAIEGHATLVMLEYLTEQAGGEPVDLGAIPDFASRLRPALEGMRSQFPALAGAPRVVQEWLLFPYVQGASFVQNLWRQGERNAPFGARLPESTEQVLSYDRFDPPVEVSLDVSGGRVLHSDVLGRLELGVLLDVHLGEGRSQLADGWGGDRYALIGAAAGGRGLVWYSVWDSAQARDLFVRAFTPALTGLGPGAVLEVVEVDGRPAASLRLGSLDGITVSVRASDLP